MLQVDIKNWNSSTNGSNITHDSQTSPGKSKKFLPSVKALRNQFETGKTNNNRQEPNGNISTSNGHNGTVTLSRKSSSSTSSLASSTLEKTSGSTNSLNSPSGSVENLLPAPSQDALRQVDPDEPVEPIFQQFKNVDDELRELMSRPPSTTGWNPVGSTHYNNVAD